MRTGLLYAVALVLVIAAFGLAFYNLSSDEVLISVHFPLVPPAVSFIAVLVDKYISYRNKIKHNN